MLLRLMLLIFIVCVDMSYCSAVAPLDFLLSTDFNQSSIYFPSKLFSLTRTFGFSPFVTPQLSGAYYLHPEQHVYYSITQ